MIKIDKLKVGDIVCTTSASPIAVAIKIKLWGWRNCFNEKLANHTGIICRRSNYSSLLYIAEMLSDGLNYTALSEYDHKHPRNHFVFVGRHPKMDGFRLSKECMINHFISNAHDAYIKYGYEDLLHFLNSKVKDNPNTLICSELPREVFRDCGITYPKQWDIDCSPKDWQTWVDLTNVTSEVLV